MKKKQTTTAEDFAAELAADPEYQAKLAQDAASREEAAEKMRERAQRVP